MSDELLEVDRYQVGERLGEGAHGAVYLGLDPKLDREVAIKVIRPEVIADPVIRRRFHREAKAIAKLHHPSILEVYDYSGETSDTAFIVMERLHGQTLGALVNARVDARPGRPLDAAVVAAAGHEICLALEHAHAQGIIHRDLKPENVFIEPDGRVVLCDFGIARAFGTHNNEPHNNEKDGETASGPQTQLIGSPLYMSPEQISAPEKLGPPSDFFALGSLMYFLATGRHAFAEATVLGILKRVIAGAHPPLAEVRPDLPPRLVQTIEAMLRVDLATRLADPSAVSDRLVAVVRDAGFADPRRALKQTLGPALEEHTRIVASATLVGKRPRKRSRAGVFAVVAMAIAFAGAMSWYFLADNSGGKNDAIAVDVPIVPEPSTPPPAPVIPTPAPALPTPSLPPKAVPPIAEAQPAAVTRPRQSKPTKPQVAPEAGEGNLKLIALPWADVFVDYEKVGTTPGFRARTLTSGRHHLKVVNPNFPTVERDFEIHTNQETRVSIDLEQP